MSTGGTIGRNFFERQLANYASYHRDLRNRATHFIGIPAIMFAILVPLALVRVPPPRSAGSRSNVWSALR